ncbi:hypothetical protein DICSQDRAFT_175576 [Dichomitus squalens LYAD-421 SS1]|uniref:Yeast cell wall synthesis Kre9/Knh1-like N-terminal domain-containing protein n=1 Tax=Dichomitus squalens (strain LYAD-421) TaxID=732165 RepID=R7SL33_DICSQ|nr:uncharacterized protein DICSQDRAFT_175576 [Dichomitus squalens LYAD-421 SS1]EJF55727.1 hypothetical protein DICSQDRAFT_175576 [Dichomitus squalens LYAD-421 SS1]
MHPVLALLAALTPTFAFLITEPSSTTVWAADGPNTIAWTKVSTDSENVTVVLNNQQLKPPVSQVLLAFVDSTVGSIVVTQAPPGGFHPGSGFVVYFAPDTHTTGTRLSISQQFRIA